MTVTAHDRHVTTLCLSSSAGEWASLSSVMLMCTSWLFTSPTFVVPSTHLLQGCLGSTLPKIPLLSSFREDSATFHVFFSKTVLTAGAGMVAH